MMTKTLKLGRERRFLSLDIAPIAGATSPLNKEARTLALSFSSELPVDRWFGKEVLSHKDGAANLSRLNDGAPLLFGHDAGSMKSLIGVVEKAGIAGGRGSATVRFAKTPEGEQAMSMVDEGVIRNVSFAYQVKSFTEADSGKAIDPGWDDFGGDRTFVADSWEAYEISLVSVPADPTVGVGRSDTGDAVDVAVTLRSKPTAIAEPLKGNAMTDQAVVPGPAATAVDIEAKLKEASAVERVRMGTILILGKKYGQEELAMSLANSDISLADAREKIWDEMTKVKQKPVGGGATVDFGKEGERYSFVRALRASLNHEWKEAGLEREISRALAQKLGRDPSAENSFFLPTGMPFLAVKNGEIQARAPYAVGAAGTGGALVETDLLAASFIEVLRNKTKVIQAGAQMLTGLVGKVDIPRQATATATFWVAESTAVTEAEATVDKVSLTPKTVGAYSILSRLTLLQTTPDIEGIIRNDFANVIAIAIDLAAISGSGASGQPTGIANTAGIGSVVAGTNGAVWTIDFLIQLEAALYVANAPEDTLAYLLNAKSVGYIKTIKATTGQYLWTQSPIGMRTTTPGEINGFPVYRTNQLRSTLTKGASGAVCSEAVFGNWSELFIGEWGALEVLANPYDATGFPKGDVTIRALQTLDIQVRHAASFAYISDALTTGF